MKVKKKIKKVLSFLVPKGFLKEKIKLFFYNINKPANTTFDIIKNNNQTIFKTTFGKTTLFTTEGLYPIVDDFNYYQHFYKTKKGDIVIDAGANVGHLSMFFSKNVGETGQVHCFEPDKFNIEALKVNMSLNKDLYDNIFIYDSLLWDKDTMIDFDEAGTVGSSAIWISDQKNVVKKQAVTIDSWVKNNNISRLNFIKMDIEGAEIEALKGCVNTIKTLKPNFAIASYHIVDNQPTYLKLEEFFTRINYPFKTITFRGNEIITFAGETVYDNKKQSK